MQHLFYFSKANFILFWAVGTKKSFEIILKYPCLIVISTFTTWTVGPLDSGACCNFFKSKKIGLSYKFTWINIILTIFGNFAGYFLYIHLYHYNTYDTIFSGSISPFVILIPLFMLGVVIPLFLIQFVNKNCSKHCPPIKKISYLDPIQMDVLKYIDDEKHQSWEIVIAIAILLLSLSIWLLAIAIAMHFGGNFLGD